MVVYHVFYPLNLRSPRGTSQGHVVGTTRVVSDGVSSSSSLLTQVFISSLCDSGVARGGQTIIGSWVTVSASRKRSSVTSSSPSLSSLLEHEPRGARGIRLQLSCSATVAGHGAAGSDAGDNKDNVIMWFAFDSSRYYVSNMEVHALRQRVNDVFEVELGCVDVDDKGVGVLSHPSRSSMGAAETGVWSGVLKSLNAVYTEKGTFLPSPRENKQWMWICTSTILTLLLVLGTLPWWVALTVGRLCSRPRSPWLMKWMSQSSYTFSFLYRRLAALDKLKLAPRWDLIQNQPPSRRPRGDSARDRLINHSTHRRLIGEYSIWRISFLLRLALDALMGCLIFVLIEQYQYHNAIVEMLNGLARSMTQPGAPPQPGDESVLVRHIYWIMGTPVGLKLNYHANERLGTTVLLALQIANDVFSMCLPYATQFVRLCTWTALLGGAALCRALMMDAVLLLCFPCVVLRTIFARMYFFALHVFAVLWRLFHGKKHNVLRLRTDTLLYDLDLLIVGTLLFAIVIFLLPTIAVYHILFSVVYGVMRVMCMTFVFVDEALLFFPIYSLSAAVLRYFWTTNRVLRVSCIQDVQILCQSSSQANEEMIGAHDLRLKASWVQPFLEYAVVVRRWRRIVSREVTLFFASVIFGRGV